MTVPLSDALRVEYQNLFDTCQINVDEHSTKLPAWPPALFNTAVDMRPSACRYRFRGSL